MAIDAAQIAIDLSGIFTDLAATGCAETATVYQPDGVTERGAGTVSILRASVLRGTDLQSTGWGSQYTLSAYVITSSDPGIAINDVLSLSDGDFRVLNIHSGPLTLYMRIDLGGLYGEET